MKLRLVTTVILLFAFAKAISQTQQDSITFDPQKQLNTAQRLLSGNYANAVTVSAYAELTYVQPEALNGVLDVPRVVLLFGYKFDERTQFVTEVEVESVNQVFVEQAFVNYNVADNISLRGGLMLVPMGIINEYHEPTTFNGTNRPAVESVIIPSTWRELGVGVTGRSNELSLGYQAYLFNGFKSASLSGSGGVDGLLFGSGGIRDGRQRGIQSTIDTPTLSTKIEYYGFPGLRLGLSGYFGRTQADDDVEELEGSDIGIAMGAFDFRYAYQRFTARGLFVYASLSDTEAYNIAASQDLGSALQGWYLEGGYNILSQDKRQKLIAFARYENYDTHANTEGSLLRNDTYNRSDITTGLSYHIASGVVVKGDYQFRDTKLPGDNRADQLNFGIGVWF